jgi:hypothetical protein
MANIEKTYRISNSSSFSKNTFEPERQVESGKFGNMAMLLMIFLQLDYFGQTRFIPLHYGGGSTSRAPHEELSLVSQFQTQAFFCIEGIDRYGVE